MAFHVALVSPERVIYEGEATIVIARGIDGEVGIQTGHAPMLIALDVGELVIREPGGGEVRAAVHGGFLDVRDSVCTILADAAELPGDIDVERARKAREAAERRAADADDAEVRAELARASLRLDIAGT